MQKLSSIPLLEGIQEFEGRSLLIFLFVKLVSPVAKYLLFILIILTMIQALGVDRNFLLSLNTYSNLILSVLSLLLVFITAYYARVTSRILAQMIEEKQSSIRPILWVTLEKPTFHESSYSSDTSKYFKTKAHIANYGKGAAVGVRTEYAIPNERNEGDTFVMPIATGRTHPELLNPGGSIEDAVNLPTRTFNIEHLYPSYLRVRVLYEDTERNLYEMKQSYYLLAAPLETIGHYLHLESESLYFIAFNNRTHLTIDECLNSDKMTRLFRRKIPWKWSKPTAQLNTRS